MLRLIGYLKPYIVPILVTIALLFVQADANLALPDYLSQIVNNGIQQGGVDSAVPTAIRQSEMSKLLIFMSDSEKAQVTSHYTLVDQSSSDYQTYLAKYPALANEPIYVRDKMDRAQIDALDPIMAKSWLIVSTLEQAMADPAKAAALSKNAPFDLSKLPPGTDVFAMLSQLPASQLSQIRAAIDKQFASFGSSTISDLAASAVKSEYEALGVNLNKLQTGYILHIGTLMLLVSLAGGVATIGAGLLASRTSAGAARDIRRDVFKKVESFSSTEFDRFSTASLITRSTNDVTQVQRVLFMILRMVFYAPIIGVGGIIRALNKGASMWWVIAAAVVALLGLIIVAFSISLPKFKIMQTLMDRLNLVARENLSGMMVIRAFNKQEFEENRFDKANRDLTDTSLFVARVMATMMPVMMLIMNGLSLLIIWVGSHQVAEATMQVGDMMAFLQYAMQIVFAFLMLSMMFIFIPRASVSGGPNCRRSGDRACDQGSAGHPSRSTASSWVGIEFRNVSFRYPGAEEDVLHDINFTAEPGQTTALIGSTGCGKSTVINLIPRFYDVTEGAIRVDGMDIREVRQSDLRDKIGYIPQQGTLFSGTIESNLRYADENASDDTLREATEIAQAERVHL